MRRFQIFRRVLWGLLFCLMAVAPGRLEASRDGAIQAGGGFGLAVRPPVRFNLQLEGEYFVLEDLSVGLNVDFLFRGGTSIGFTGFGRYHIDIPSAPRWVPYVGGGVGGFVNTNGGGFFDLMIPEFGFRYELISERLFLGPDLSFHIVSGTGGTTWDFRVLFATASFRF